MALLPAPGVMSQASRLVKLERVQPRIKAASAAAVDNAGTDQFQTLVTASTNGLEAPLILQSASKAAPGL